MTSIMFRRLSTAFILLTTIAHAAIETSSKTLDVASCSLESDIFDQTFQLSSNQINQSFPFPVIGNKLISIICRDDQSNSVFENSFNFNFQVGSFASIFLNLVPPSYASSQDMAPIIKSIKAIPAWSSSSVDINVDTYDALYLSEPNSRSIDITSSDAAVNILSTDNCQNSASTCSLQRVSSATASVLSFQVEDQGGMHTTTSFLSGADTRPNSVLFDSTPVITNLTYTDFVLRGTTETIYASFFDADISPVTSSSYHLHYSWTIDHMSGSTVVTPGGGGACPLSGLSAPNGLSHDFINNGHVYNTWVSYSPLATGADVECRITLTVTDEYGFETQASAQFTVSSTPSSASEITHGNPIIDVLPVQIVLENFELEVNLIVADKCEGVVCPSSTQCLYASECDSATGQCMSQVPKTGQACDDNDITTRDDTCASDGLCYGTSKCQGVVCQAQSTCHLPGTCEPSTGVCGDGPARPQGSLCDDGNIDTKFDICDENAICIGLDVEDLVNYPQTPFAQVNSQSVEEIMNELESRPNVCCNRMEAICCSPCDSGASCGPGDYDNLYYLQSPKQSS